MANKTSMKAGHAFLTKTNFSGGNTMVSQEWLDDDKETPIMQMRLHGNLIAQWDFEGIKISDGRYVSPTTRDRLAGILEQRTPKMTASAKDSIMHVKWLESTTERSDHLYPIYGWVNLKEPARYFKCESNPIDVIIENIPQKDIREMINHFGYIQRNINNALGRLSYMKNDTEIESSTKVIIEVIENRIWDSKFEKAQRYPEAIRNIFKKALNGKTDIWRV